MAVELPVLRVIGPDIDTGRYFIEASSYGFSAPSGLGEFDTEEAATAAMNALQKKIDEQGKRKQPTKKQVRSAGAD